MYYALNDNPHQVGGREGGCLDLFWSSIDFFSLWNIFLLLEIIRNMINKNPRTLHFSPAIVHAFYLIKSIKLLKNMIRAI